MKNTFWKITGGVIGTSLLLIVPSLVSAFSTHEDFQFTCDENHKIVVSANFKNNESTETLHVTATDNQFHVSADLGTVAPGQTINRTFNTELQSFGAGSVTVKAAKASDENVFTTDTVNYPSFSCNGSVTPTPTQEVTPTPTQSVTPTDEPTVTPTDTPAGSDDNNSGTNNCDNDQNNNGGTANNNCNNNSNSNTNNNTQNNNQNVNVTVNDSDANNTQVLAATNVSNLPSTGTPLSDLLFLGGMLPTGIIIRKFIK